jgi:hypothetical protein
LIAASLSRMRRERPLFDIGTRHRLSDRVMSRQRAIRASPLRAPVSTRKRMKSVRNGWFTRSQAARRRPISSGERNLCR